MEAFKGGGGGGGGRPRTKIRSADYVLHGIVRVILISTELIALSTDVSQSR